MKKIILLLIIFYGSSKISNAQPGNLDLSFGNNGIVTTDAGINYAYDYGIIARQIAVDPDGDIYILLKFDNFHCIAKKHTDGSPDLHYGKNGLSDLIVAGDAAAALQVDGKMIVIGNRFIARYDRRGKLDTSFGVYGKKFFDYSNRAFAFQNDGKIIIIAYTHIEGNYIEVLARYNTDGSLDSTFPVTTLPAFRGSGLGVQDDGKIVIVGAGNGDFIIQRYHSNGTKDSTFSDDGVQTADFSPSDFALDVVLQSDGKMLVSGARIIGGKRVPAFVRLNSNGSFDSSFSNDGKMHHNLNLIGVETVPKSVAIQNDGKIVVAYTPFIARYKPDGKSDSSFGDNGLLKVFFDTPGYFATAVLQENGSILTAGSKDGSTTIYTVVRFYADGSLDSSFDTDGKLTDKIDFGQGSTTYTGTAVQYDGKVVASGSAWNGANYDLALVRYTKNGALDDTFAGGGIQLTDLGYNEYASSLFIQPNGKIVVVVYSDDPSDNNPINYFILRYNPDGSLDTTFGLDGIQQIDIPVASLAVQDDGKIVIASSPGFNFAVARYNTDGSPDKSFSDDGRLITDFGSDDEATELLIQSNGKILVIGNSSGHYNGFSVARARYNADGSPDNSFSADGKQLTRVKTYHRGRINAAVLQNNGKLLVAGVVQPDSGPTKIVFSRYNADGSLDSTFRKGSQVIQENGSIRAIKLQNDGKIIALMSGAEVRRYNEDGNLDKSFSGDGIQTIQQVGFRGNVVTGIAVLNNKLYTSGYGGFPGNLGIVEAYLLGEGSQSPLSVRLTSPGNNTVYLAGGNVYLDAVVSYFDNPINKVEFYYDSVLLYTAVNAPYTFKWQHVKPGNYTLTAKATDDLGLVTISTPVQIIVAPNKAPVVSIITPTDSLAYLKGRTAHIEAAASDTDGRITKVEFYNGTTLLTTERQLPYTFDLKNMQHGEYIITVKAIDNWGAVTTSAPVQLFVVDKTQCPSESQPTFGFTSYDSPLANINNGIIDAGESDTIFICEGQEYSTSGHFSSSSSTLIDIANFATGDALLFYYQPEFNNDRVVTANDFSNISGTSSIFLADPYVEGSLTQIITPFTDINNNKILDGDDCAGDPIVITFYVKHCVGQQCPAAFLPTINFTVNNLPAGNINNGSADPGELISLTVCNGTKFSLSSIYHSHYSTTYKFTYEHIGGLVLVNGIVLFDQTFGTTNLDSLIGTLSIPSGVARILKITITPFIDFNYNAEIDEGDCAGEPIVISITVPQCNGNNISVTSKRGLLTGSIAPNALASLQLAPNPTKNIVNIYTTGLQSDKQTSLSIISATGVIMKTLKIAGPHQTIPLDVSSFASGVYTVKIINGEKVLYKKLVKL